MYSKQISFKFISILLFCVIGNAVVYKEKLPYLDTFFVGANIFSFFCLTFLFLKQRLKISFYYFCWMIYYAIVIYSSILHNVKYFGNVLTPTLNVIVLMFIMILGFEQNVNKMLKSLSSVFFVYVLLNFILILMYPDGIWRDYVGGSMDEVGRFIIGGNRNQMGATLMAASLTGILCYQKTHSYFSIMSLIVLLSFISVIIIGSKTSLAGFFILFVFIYMKKENYKRFFLKGFIVFYWIWQIFIVFIPTDLSKFQFLKYVIVDFLNKDLTFTFRATIWELSSFMIMKSPIWGYGYQTFDWYKFYISGVNTHNYIYSLLIKGGVIALFVISIVIIIAIKQTMKDKSKSRLFALMGLLIFFFMMITEVYNDLIIFYVVSLVYSMKYFRNPSFSNNCK